MEAAAALATLLPPLLRAQEALGFIARHLHPPDLAEVVALAGAPDAALREASDATAGATWPDHLLPVRERLAEATRLILEGHTRLHAAAAADQDGLREAWRALRLEFRAQESLYPLAPLLSPVSRFFLPQGQGEGPAPGQVIAMENGRDQRGGFSAYIPAGLDAAQPVPLAMVLHGGRGHGADFLWPWLRAARAQGVLLLAPTALGPTWSFQGEDTDTPNLHRMLDWARSRWPVDSRRILLAGMSDGGTFALYSGLQEGSPFTHLAPCATGFHPLLVDMQSPARLDALPVLLQHGALDWMFPASRARATAKALRQAGALVTYREIEDLSHSFPREETGPILSWLRG